MAVSDVPATVQFYKEVLGFPNSWMSGEPPSIAGVSWGKVSLMFSLRPDRVAYVEGVEQWIDVEDVNGLYALHVERGAPIMSEIENKPWDRREYTVRDPNGYFLRFAGVPNHLPKGSGAFPAGVQIVQRMPTVEEFDAVAGMDFYRGRTAGLLAGTWRAVVATDADGKVIGALRIMYDAPGWYSIWDVAVLPEWQGQRIGTAMMEAALEIVREESPGAHVHLFTTKDGFYERIGFERGSMMARRV